MSDYPPLLTVPQFRNWSLMPSVQIDQLEQNSPGFLAQQITFITSEIYAQLAKRYSVPFNPPPAIVVGWALYKLGVVAYRKRGVDPDDSSFRAMVADVTNADDQIKRAADCVTGLFDLPLSESAASAVSAISQGNTKSTSQQSPYAWTDQQAAAIQNGGIPLVIL
jgi:hypothetical protein